MSADGCESGDVDPKWLIGVCACIAGSFVTCLGMCLQKLAHIRNDQLPDEEKQKEVAGILCTPMWWVGFLLMTLLCVPGDLLAMALTPQSVLAPLSGVTIVLCQIVAPYLLKTETMTRLDWVASICIAVGCGLTTMTGSHCSKEYAIDDLLDLFTKVPFIVHEVLAALLFLSMTIWIKYGIPAFVAEDLRHRYTAVCYCLLSGLFAGQSNMFFKAAAEVLEMTVSGDSSGWEHPSTYCFIFALIVSATAQMSYMNQALQIWTAIKVSPLYFASLILFSTVSGTVLYQEYKQITLMGFFLFPFAITLILGSILLLTRKEEKVIPVDVESPKAEVVTEAVTVDQPPDSFIQDRNIIATLAIESGTLVTKLRPISRRSSAILQGLLQQKTIADENCGTLAAIKKESTIPRSPVPSQERSVIDCAPKPAVVSQTALHNS